MRRRELRMEVRKFLRGIGILVFCFSALGPLRAQVAGGTGNAAEASLQRTIARAAMAAFSPDQAGGEKQNQAKPPSSNPQAPSLPDLGFPPDQTQGSAAAQARLDRRSHMLRTHQQLGLLTTIPLLVTVITSGGAGGRHPSATGRDLHGALGLVTVGMYVTTASYAIRAPRVPGTTTRGPIRLHKTLAWIHGPGMILTSILGVMAYDQLSNGEKVHGIAKAHGAVGWVTSAAYGAAILSVSIKF